MANETGGVQTIDRTFRLLEIIADDEGDSVTLTALASSSGLPLPTVYRLLRTMVGLGYVRQLPSRRYGLGPRLIRLGERAGRALSSTAVPFLAELVDRTEETANLAMLDGDMIVYVAQVPSKHSMRMFTEIGRRVLPHTTGVGKAILAQMDDDSVAKLVGRTGMPPRTERTITALDTLLKDLELIRQRGWAEDNGEQEIGVRCLSAAIAGANVPAAVSVSGPEARITADATDRIAPAVVDIADRLSRIFTAADQ